jgi:hypothetical protein
LRDGGNDRTIVSIIPWSEKYQADVDSLIAAMDATGDRILKALAPNAIESTLASGNCLMLPKPTA